VISFAIWYSVQAWTPVAPRSDPLVRMPGTQPGGLVLDGPGFCDCHLNYDTAVPKYDKATEPVWNWKGAMMSQASRDFLFWSAMTVAAQDSIWAFGRPAATDLCLRCHAPKGWIEGRTNQLNGSSLTANDFDGVSCEFCHVLYDPFFEDTYAGTREGNDWAGYFDESNLSSLPSAAAAAVTYNLDASLATGISYFNGQPFFVNNRPASPGYTQSSSGQYFLAGDVNHRAGFSDTSPSKTNYNYSRFHKSKYFCGTCHDVSNPILANLNANPAQPLPSETNSAFSYYHLQRTSSEFLLSTWGQTGGAPGIGPYDPSVFSTNLANNYIAKCQDCHMSEKTGYAARGGTDALLRPTASLEHPNSGVSTHDQTGANPWVSTILGSVVTTSPYYDATNRTLLNQGPTVLTLDLAQGYPIGPLALQEGVNRVKANLARAAAIQNVAYEPVTGSLSFRIQNYTAHKLITGYPEGRRMFVNIRAYQNGTLVYEVNPYDTAAGTLKGLGYSYQADTNAPLPVALSGSESYLDALVYEMIPTSSLTGEQKSFHFALATGRYKDNRIPPKGFDIANAAARLSEPVWQGVSAPDYFSAVEYGGGYDDVALTILSGADQVEIKLYIQTTSREYIEFLRNEIRGVGPLTLTSPAPSGEPQAYIIQSDAFFSRLKAWGNTLWELWKRNKNVSGGAPYQIATGSWIYPDATFLPFVRK
jgi:hypothetical protein